MTAADYERIDEHLDGKLDFNALSAGKSAVETNELRVAVEEQRRARQSINLAALRAGLHGIHRERLNATSRKIPAPKITRNHRVRSWLAIAAAALLVLGVLGYVWNLAPQDRYADLYYRDPGLPVVMGVANDPAFAAAMTQFKLADFSGAGTAFATLLVDAPNNDTLVYYRGAAALYDGNPELAISGLVSVSQDTNSLFRERADYLLAFAHLDAGNQQQATAQLRQITAAPAHRFADRAATLLRRIEE